MDRAKEEVIEEDPTPWMDKGVVVKQEPEWFMEEDSPDQPSAVYSTEHVQPMPDNTCGSMLSLKRGCVCQHCSAAFVLVSSLELHLASVHREPLPFPESSDRQTSLPHGRLSTDKMDHVGKHSADSETEHVWMSSPHGRLSTEETDHFREHSADTAVEFVVKLEPPWSSEEDSPDQSSAVYSTAQDMSDNTCTSHLSLDLKHPCYVCSAAFVTLSSLELHLASVHGEKLHMVIPGSSTPDRCDVGNCTNTDVYKGVKNRRNKKTPKKKVDDGRTGHKGGKKKTSHVCDICGKSFTRPNHLKTHKMIHSGVRPFVCDVCSKGFTEAGNLTKHMRVHTGERPYKCPRCDSSFKISGHLQLHIRSVHEGAKPHVCNVCGAAFSQTCDLTRHRRVHTGVKPFVCPDCGIAFAQSTNLTKHRLTHI